LTTRKGLEDSDYNVMINHILSLSQKLKDCMLKLELRVLLSHCGTNNVCTSIHVVQKL